MIYKSYSHFQPKKPTYTCRHCSKRTRETGEGESELDLCKRCYLIAQYENAISDLHMTRAEAIAALAEMDIEPDEGWMASRM